MKIFKILACYWFMLTGVMPAYAFQSRQPYDSSEVTEQQLIDGKTAYIKGLEQFEQENYKKALDLLSEAYVKLPDHSGVNYAMADAYMQLGDLTNAEYYSKQATRLEPKNKWYHLKLADIYRRSGKTEATISELETALKYNPGDADILYELAQTFTDQNDLLKSNKVYNKLLKQTGDDISIHLQKLKNFNNLNMRDSAVAELRKIRRLDPGNLSTMQLMSNYYLDMGKKDRAKSILKEALDKNNRDPKTLIMLSGIYLDEAKWDSVGILLGNIISDPIVNPEAKLSVARYLYSRYKQNPSNQKLSAATGNLIDAFTDSEPDYAQAYALAAEFYIKAKQNEKALKALEKTNSMQPSNDTAWKQRLQLLLSEGNYEEAITVGSKASEQVPQDPFILYFWGSAYLAKGQNEPAAEKLEEAQNLPSRKPLKSAIYSSLGDAYTGLKKWNRAFITYEKALNVDPDNAIVLNNFAYYLSLQKKQLDKAEKMALKAIRQEPKNPSFLDTVGWIYYQKGNYQKARDYIKASIDAGRASAEVLEHMGDVMNKLNKHEDARNWWKKALEKDSTRTHLQKKLSQ